MTRAAPASAADAAHVEALGVDKFLGLISEYMGGATFAPAVPAVHVSAHGPSSSSTAPAPAAELGTPHASLPELASPRMVPDMTCHAY